MRGKEGQGTRQRPRRHASVTHQDTPKGTLSWRRSRASTNFILADGKGKRIATNVHQNSTPKYSKEIKAYVYTKICTQMFRAPL